MSLRSSVLGVLLMACTPAWAGEPVDLSMVHRFRAEAFERSQVMDHLFYLTDVKGARLSGSPGYRAAAAWSVARLKEWDADRPRLEPWGEFGRGWSHSRLVVTMRTPVPAPLMGVPLAWCAGTRGPVRGDAILAPLFDEDRAADRYDLTRLAERIEEYAQQFAGSLKGRVVLIDPARKFEAVPGAPSERLGDEALATVAAAPDPVPRPPLEWPLTVVPADARERGRLLDSLPLEVAAGYFAQKRRIMERLNAFLRDEGATAVLSVDGRGDGGLIFVEGTGAWRTGSAIPPPSIVLVPEEYNRIVRLLEKDIPVEIEVELDARFEEDPQEGLNVLAEIPGNAKKKEIVMLGAHLDSWHAGTGAADNAAGSAVALEAMRILKALNVTMDRTVRLALWGGEEQGLLGSRAYVRDHFGDPNTMKLKPEHAHLAAYFNLDNGSGKIRGVHLQGNDMVRPIFDAWLKPFADLGAGTMTIRKTGGTDHRSFDAVGLPGFQFVQDPLDYMSRTHHSNLDHYDHVQPGDLMQASAIMAFFVYQAATRPEMLPRKPLPDPLPEKKVDERPH